MPEHISQEVRQDTGGDARRVGAQQDTQRLTAEDLPAEVKHSRQVTFQLPDLAFTAAAKRGWVQHNGIICVATTDFAGEKLADIFHHPADVRRSQTGELRVVPRPGNDAISRIEMDDVSPRLPRLPMTLRRCRQKY